MNNIANASYRHVLLKVSRLYISDFKGNFDAAKRHNICDPLEMFS